jgi:hypothetical protein
MYPPMKNVKRITVDGGFISTTYLAFNADAADTRHAKVDIETGRIIF